MVEIREIEYFVAVAEERSFTRGAARAGVVQSSASAAVARLERELGHTFFVRTGRSVELTDSGRIFLIRARLLLADVRVAREELDRPAGEIGGSVTVGIVLTTGDFDLATALARFRIDYPKVEVRVRLTPGRVGQHAAAVANGSVDLALLPTVREWPGVAVTRVGGIQLALACAADDPVAQQSAVDCRAVADRPFIDFPTEWGNREVVDAMFVAAGCERRVAIEVDDLATATALVRGGVGLCFLPRPYVLDTPQLAVVDLAPEPPAHDLGVAVAVDRPIPPAVEALHSTLVGA